MGDLDLQDALDDRTLQVMKKLDYSLPMTTFSQTECRQILQLALKGGSLASDICRNMPRDTMHAALCCQGLGIPSLYVIQGISHIKALIDTTPTNSIT